MVFLAQTALFMISVAGIIACTLMLIFFAGGAMNKARPAEMQRRRWALAALSLGGIVASATLGFVGVPAILYLAQQ